MTKPAEHPLRKGIFERVVNKFCVPALPATIRRPSFDERTGSDARSAIHLINANKALGDAFPFMNRERECLELVRIFLGNAKMRNIGEYESVKRELTLPVCTGIPGVGKTRFVRAAVIHLAEKNGYSGLDTLESAARSIVTQLAVSPAEVEASVQLVKSFILASIEGRNIRISLSGVSEVSVQREAAYAILAEWSKCREPLDQFKRLTTEQLSARIVNALRFADTTKSFRLHDALQIIEAAMVSESELPVFTIVNIDEAQLLSEKALQELVTCAGKSLVNSDAGILLTITGMNVREIYDGVTSTGSRLARVYLPPLTEEHMLQITALLLDVPQSASKNPLADALWWLGGIPRHLQRYLVTLGGKFDAPTLGALKNALFPTTAGAGELCIAASMDDFMSAIQALAFTMYEYIMDAGPLGIPSVVVDRVFSLAVAKQLVTMDTVLHPHHPVWTVRYAQARGIIYGKPVEGDNFTVILPAVLLHAAHLRRHAGTMPSLHNLRFLAHPLAPDDDEMQTIAILMHKMRAAQIAGRPTIRLSELLGGVLLLPRIPDVELPIPRVFTVESLHERITKGKKLKAFVAHTRARLASAPDVSRVAFMNGTKAKISDGFIVFPTLTIHIKEEQGVFFKLAEAAGHPVERLCMKDVVAEAKKVLSGGDILLFVTDERPIMDAALPVNIIVVHRDLHAELLGDIVARLRGHTLADSAARDGSADVEEASKRKCVIQ